jgi:predicted Zn-ribbon and HTH transcriptional regulator
MSYKKKYKCKHCSYQWLSRVEVPVQCPRCKRYDYNKEEVKEVKQNENIPNRV